MANKPDVNKRHVTLRVYVETCHAVEKEFGRKGDRSKGEAFIRALEESVRDVELTSKDYALIQAEVKRNEQARNRIAGKTNNKKEVQNG